MKKILVISFLIFIISSLIAQEDNRNQFRFDSKNQYRSKAERLRAFEPGKTERAEEKIPQLNRYTSNPMQMFSGGAVDTAWLRHYGSGLAPSKDYAARIVADNVGNVYVTGNSGGTYFSTDYVTIKYNPNGDTLWVRRYNGSGNENDNASSLAVDGSGNVYVSGSSYNLGTYFDYATIKYNSNGDTLWVRRYSGPESYEDNATSLAVDGSGNVYVTGWSYSLGTHFDYTTIKYNSNGDTLWVRRYNWSGNSDDYANSIAVDGSGNVYVMGSSNGDYATIKYNSNGDMLWVRRYSVTANSYDAASSLAVDGSGNVYVTGSSNGAYATIKYNSNGDTLWVRRYNGTAQNSNNASSLAVDGSGNVYVTGWSFSLGTSFTYATIKYNTNGDMLWVRIYIGFGQGDEDQHSFTVAVDGSGNVYMTGSSDGAGTSADYATIKYNSNGDMLWVRRYDGPGNYEDNANSLAVDGSGNVYVTGSSYDSVTSFDYATIKYNSNGDTLWVKRYNGPGHSEEGAGSFAVDGSGNVYVTGSSFGSGTSIDYATIKYNSNGDALWVKRYNGPGNGNDNAKSLAVDVSGNVYVTGNSLGSESSIDYATIKYNSDGHALWVKRYNGPGNSEDSPSSLVVDGSGNVYVTGSSYGSLTFNDYATIKYNSNGDTLWVRRYNGSGNSEDYAKSIAVDGSGNVYVMGSSNFDYATIKYNSNGDMLWVRRYSGTANSYDAASSLAVDGSGNVYVTGSSDDAYATIKYNPIGDTLWVRRYKDPGKSFSVAISLTVDGSGNVYVSGSNYFSVKLKNYATNTYNSSIDDYLMNYATIKYNSDGDTVWVRRHIVPAPMFGEEVAVSLAVDGSGNVYVTCKSYQQYHNEIFTTKYTATGNEEWTAVHSYGFNTSSSPVGIQVDASGNVYVAGTSASNHQSLYTVIKYKQLPASVDNSSHQIPARFSLEQNYPNPFNPSTKIKYSIPEISDPSAGLRASRGTGIRVTLKVYDVMGREVAVLVNEEKAPGSYEVDFSVARISNLRGSELSSGVYFYQLRAGSDVVITKKMILLK